MAACFGGYCNVDYNLLIKVMGNTSGGEQCWRGQVQVDVLPGGPGAFVSKPRNHWFWNWSNGDCGTTGLVADAADVAEADAARSLSQSLPQSDPLVSHRAHCHSIIGGSAAWSTRVRRANIVRAIPLSHIDTVDRKTPLLLRHVQSAGKWRD